MSETARSRLTPLVVESAESGRRLFYAPGLGEMEPQVWAAQLQAQAPQVQQPDASARP